MGKHVLRTQIIGCQAAFSLNIAFDADHPAIHIKSAHPALQGKGVLDNTCFLFLCFSLSAALPRFGCYSPWRSATCRCSYFPLPPSPTFLFGLAHLALSYFPSPPSPSPSSSYIPSPKKSCMLPIRHLWVFVFPLFPFSLPALPFPPSPIPLSPLSRRTCCPPPVGVSLSLLLVSPSQSAHPSCRVQGMLEYCVTCVLYLAVCSDRSAA